VALAISCAVARQPMGIARGTGRADVDRCRAELITRRIWARWEFSNSRASCMSSLVALWPVVLGAVLLGFLIGELNDCASSASIRGFAQQITIWSNNFTLPRSRYLDHDVIVGRFRAIGLVNFWTVLLELQRSLTHLAGGLSSSSAAGVLITS
jgi:hypothetical protein